MQLRVRESRPWLSTLGALIALELANVTIWWALMLSPHVFGGTLLLSTLQPAFLGVIGAYPILLLTPLLVKYLVKGSSLLPLYVINLLQMVALTWGVVR